MTPPILNLDTTFEADLSMEMWGIFCQVRTDFESATYMSLAL
jgi:hypothetical protein